MRPIVVCGIPRSGSTLVGQIVQEVFSEQHVLKTHPADTGWMPGDEWIIFTIRDPRDVVASLYRVRLSRGGDNVAGRAGLDAVLGRVQQHFDALSLMRVPVGSVLLRYEAFVHDYGVVFDGVQALTQRRIPAPQRSHISTKFSLGANRHRADKLKDFNEVGDYQIHGDHIGAVEPGMWRKSLPEWGLKRVCDVCQPFVKEWGYENQS